MRVCLYTDRDIIWDLHMLTFRAKFTLWLLLAVCAGSALLSGCGQRGPLYLPDDTAQTQKKKPDSATHTP